MFARYANASKFNNDQQNPNKNLRSRLNNLLNAETLGAGMSFKGSND